MNVGVAFWICVGVVLTALATWGLAHLALDGWWPAWIGVGLVSLFGVVWIIAGAGTLFEYPADDDDGADSS